MPSVDAVARSRQNSSKSTQQLLHYADAIATVGAIPGE